MSYNDSQFENEAFLGALSTSFALYFLNIFINYNLQSFPNIRLIFSQSFNPQTKNFFKTLLNENADKSKTEKEYETNLLKEIINFEIL